MLALAVTTHLYPRLEAERFGAGRLTKIRAQAVSGRACRRVALALHVPDRMRETAPEAGGRNVESLVGTERALASVIEAIIGACYLTYGYGETAPAVIGAFADEIEQALSESEDFKSQLQERLAQRGETVAYEVVEEEGPPHDRRFAVEARVNGRALGRGEGKSKKESEQEAARRALADLDG